VYRFTHFCGGVKMTLSKAQIKAIGNDVHLKLCHMFVAAPTSSESLLALFEGVMQYVATASAAAAPPAWADDALIRVFRGSQPRRVSILRLKGSSAVAHLGRRKRSVRIGYGNCCSDVALHAAKDAYRAVVHSMPAEDPTIAKCLEAIGMHIVFLCLLN
jgi:hypothetical protein